MQYDVFISYSSADRDFADALQRRLSSDGVSVFIDTVNIGWGESNPQSDL